MMIPIIINNRDRLGYTRDLADRAAALPDVEVIIVDNASTYPPLLEWYAACPYQVERLDSNLGHLAPWRAGVVSRYAEDFYVVTDHDLDISAAPQDLLQFLSAALLTHSATKCGLSIRLDDLPDNPMTQQVRAHEAQFWTRPLGGGIFRAEVDTTFAMYSKCRHDPGLGNSWWTVCDSLRTDAPYTCRHLPWYITPENVTDEDLYYFEHADRGTASWSDRIMSIIGDAQ